MKALALVAFLAACPAHAADVHFAWLPLSSNIPGIPQSATAVDEYGVQVFMDSDNPAVTAFQVTVVVQLSSGDIVPLHATVARQPKDSGVLYSSIFSTWVDTNPNFQLLAIQVNAIVGLTATKPLAAKDYNNGPPPLASLN
jgi:hypothetical protein